MNRRRKDFLCFALAIAFATNSLWLFPHADEPRYEYRAVELTDDNRHHSLEHRPEVKECYIIFSRVCGLEHRVRDEPLRLNLNEMDSSKYLEDDYRFVAFSDGFRKSTHRTENGWLILSSKPVSGRTAAAELAVPYEDARSSVRRVFDNGNVTTNDELPRNYLVRQNGSFHVIDKIGERHPSYGFELVVLRTLLQLAIIPLSVAGFVYRYG